MVGPMESVCTMVVAIGIACVRNDSVDQVSNSKSLTNNL